MLPESLLPALTCHFTATSDGTTYTIVRPGLGFAMYYSDPLHVIGDAVDRIVDAYLGIVPQGAISTLCLTSRWGRFSSSALARQLKKLRSKDIDYTNVDLGSGALLASAGPYGFHINGGNLSNTAIRPDNTNVIYHELPHNEIQRMGASRVVDWAVSVAELYPFETGQLGYSFNQLQRTWTTEADDFVGKVAMRFLGFDILEPDLARVARGKVPNCSWLNFLGDRIVMKLGGESLVRAAVSDAVTVRRIAGGLMLVAGQLPPVGDVNRHALDLGPVREVARLTRPLRPEKKVLFYGTEEFRNGWVHRFDG